jgi:DNA-binding GntR family transcriptional regulator
MEEHFQTPEMRASALKEHWAILAALEARDARKSRAAMRGHIRRVSADFAQGWELLKGQKNAAGGARRSVRAIRAPSAGR